VSWLVVSVHDVAPATAAAARAWVEDLSSLGVPLSLLVVPGPWQSARTLLDDAETAVWLHQRLRAGDEIIQHGWRHQAAPGGSWWRQAMGQVVARGCAEFTALDQAEATRRIAKGREVLARVGLHPVGFTPPGWLASPAVGSALRACGFRYTTSHLGIHRLDDDRFVRAFALSHRPGGRGERLGCELLARSARRAAARGSPVRIAVHPADRDRPGLVDATLAAVADVVALGARPTTYSQVAGVAEPGAADPGVVEPRVVESGPRPGIAPRAS
jgi:predicted deacetylase